MRSVVQRGELRVYDRSDRRSFDPAELTRLLGITPSRTWRRGEALRSGRTRTHTVWWWETPERAGPDSEALVREVLDTFEPVVDALVNASADWGLELVLGLVIHMNGTIEIDNGSPWADVPTPGLALSLETVERLARLRCHLDVDQYVSAPED